MGVVPRLASFGRYERSSDAPPMLVIDDDGAGARSTAALLAEGGYPAVGESDGDAVPRRVRTQPLRPVVSELHLPCADGPCVVAALKPDRVRLPRLRVIADTRHVSRADIEWALAAGCDAIVQRGVPPALLLREVQRLDGACIDQATR
jgi:CheY-like chemotaxis protein